MSTWLAIFKFKSTLKKWSVLKTLNEIPNLFYFNRGFSRTKRWKWENRNSKTMFNYRGWPYLISINGTISGVSPACIDLNRVKLLNFLRKIAQEPLMIVVNFFPYECTSALIQIVYANCQCSKFITKERINHWRFPMRSTAIE